MLKSHVDAIEGSLLEIAKVPANSGHSLHKGTPREAFIREFLQGHLSEQGNWFQFCSLPWPSARNIIAPRLRTGDAR
jgi:hypothetical protein